MIRLGELLNRQVVDLDAAEKLGEIHEVILDPDQRVVAGLVLVHGRTILGGGTERLIPASQVHSIGTDAVTVRGLAQASVGSDLAGLPRRHHVVGRKVVGESGDLFGHITDVLIDPADGHLVGYQVGEAAGRGTLENIFTPARDRDHGHRYIRAEAELRVGPEIVVVPDDALVAIDSNTVEAHGVTPAEGARGWGHGVSPHVPGSVWTTTAAAPVAPPAPDHVASPSAHGTEAAPGLDVRHVRAFEEMRPPAWRQPLDPNSEV